MHKEELEEAKRYFAKERKRENNKILLLCTLGLVIFVGFIWWSQGQKKIETPEDKAIRAQMCKDYQPGTPTYSERIDGESPELDCSNL